MVDRYFGLKFSSLFRWLENPVLVPQEGRPMSQMLNVFVYFGCFMVAWKPKCCTDGVVYFVDSPFVCGHGPLLFNA